MLFGPQRTRAGEVFLLKPVEQAHVPALFALAKANQDRLGPWLPWIDATGSEADTAAFVEAAVKQNAEQRGFHAGIWLEGALAGAVGMHPVDWANRGVSLGYWVGEEFEGKGLIRAAVARVVHHCFLDLKLERVEIRAGVGNERSRAVAERLGFQLEGVFRHAQLVRGRYLDMAIYSQLAWEFEERLGLSRTTEPAPLGPVR